MQAFFESPYMFWYSFVFSFLVCTGLGAFVQCWFIIRFCGVKCRIGYYISYLILSYMMYLCAITISAQISPILDTLIGALIVFAFTNIVLRQSHVMSAISAALSMSVTALSESAIFILAQYTAPIKAPFLFAVVIEGVLFPLFSFMMFQFIVSRYRIKSRLQPNYLILFALPVFFISIVLRMVNYIRYTVTTEGIVLQSSQIKNLEAVILTFASFLSVCIILFAYERTVKQIESDSRESLLNTQICAQKSYVAEARQKYEATKAFRHDFKNHLTALHGLIRQGDLKKADIYMERFGEIYQDITFSIQTGNSVIDILLGEKLSYAEQLGIQIKCDISIPERVRVDDFDLCTIFANTVDNAIKACNSMQTGEKVIDIAAKATLDFLIIDIVNTYQAGAVPKGSGTGLMAVHTVTEKYHGAVEIEDALGQYRISVILPFEEPPCVCAS